MNPNYLALAGLLSNFSAIPGQQNPMSGLGPSLLSMAQNNTPDALEAARLKNSLLQQQLANSADEQRAKRFELERAQQQQTALNNFASLLGTPETFAQDPTKNMGLLASYLAQAGDPKAAFALMQPPAPPKLDDNIQAYQQAKDMGIVPQDTTFEGFMGMVKKPLIQQTLGGTPELPTPALKMQDEALTNIGTVSNLNSTLKDFEDMITRGKLSLGPLQNAESEIRLAAGISNQNNRNYGSFKAELEKMRNESLRLNAGVQTEGDAKRIWNELISNITDEKFVVQRLQEIQKLNDKAAKLQLAKINTIRENSKLPALTPQNLEDMGISMPKANPAAGQAAPPPGTVIRRQSGGSGQW